MPNLKALPDNGVIRYHGLMGIWHRETAIMSFRIAEHPAYKEILVLRYDIPLVQLLLDDIYKYPHQCFPLLWEIVPNPPEVPEEMKGKIKEICILWKEWGKANGYS